MGLFYLVEVKPIGYSFQTNIWFKDFLIFFILVDLSERRANVVKYVNLVHLNILPVERLGHIFKYYYSVSMLKHSILFLVEPIYCSYFKVSFLCNSYEDILKSSWCRPV